MIHAIICNFGYVEDGIVGEVWYTNSRGFKTKIDAVKHLGAELYRNYLDDHQIILEKCCAKRVKEAFYSFCPDCGRSFALARDFQEEDFRNWLKSIPGLTNNDYHHMDDTSEGGWWPWSTVWELTSLEKSCILELDQAELFLSAGADPCQKDTNRLEWCERKGKWDYFPDDYTLEKDQ